MLRATNTFSKKKLSEDYIFAFLRNKLPPTLKASNPDFEAFKLPLSCLVTPRDIDDNWDNIMTMFF